MALHADRLHAQRLHNKGEAAEHSRGELQRVGDVIASHICLHLCTLLWAG